MITDRQAQRIAAQWHSGQTSALYALSSSGAVTDHTRYESSALMIATQGTDTIAYTHLRNLTDYIDNILSRTPTGRAAVPGWYDRVIKESAR